MPVDLASDVVGRAKTCLGVPFLLHGRSPSQGLDCIGLVGFALDVPECRRGYRMRGDHRAEIEAGLAAVGLLCVDQRPTAGDILILNTGPHQLHCAVQTMDGFIHADATLRRVVETPGAPRWPTLSVWRAM